jgi:hypothetical protein
MFREDQENRPIASFASKNFDTHSMLSKGASEMEADPNSVSIIRELLSSDGEWAAVPEIMKLTMTAFYRVISSHSASIQEIENILPMKANKVDISSMMNAKANVKDIRKTIADMAQDIENKTTVDEVKQIVNSSGTVRGKTVSNHFYRLKTNSV